MKGNWTISLLAAAMFAASVGCSVKRPAAASVPHATQEPISSVGTESNPVANGSGTASAGASPGEVALDYDRVVVPPLQPATPIQDEAEEVGSTTPAPSSITPSRTRRPQPTQTARTPEPEPSGEAEAAKPTEVRAPSLKPMLSDAERRQLDVQISGHLDRARRNFSLIRDARLGSNEKSVLEEAKSFATRADQLRRNDPVLANSLAERAAILTQELLRKQ